ncbi:sp110 nuclear body protein isoform X3 [Vulpes lagopus]|uniref:sp110 nuclear body protein isoform X3 n=1 Tax=Vulpes lagopus TaxID=494514 RepID=UPI001BC8F6F1|nr:sp110 nuclear body protein isoform X3 [Vulpes lagopus]
MADLASRMPTLTKATEETLHQHFVYQKLEIAYAIYKPFPFLEGLRDNSIITETMYRESMEAYRNKVPIPRVVYNILTHLEKTFNLSFLEILFSQINLYEYPTLKTILKGFKNAVISYRQRNRTVPTLLEAPAYPAEGRSLQTLLPLLPPQHPPHAPSVSEPSTSTQHRAEILGEPSSPPGPAVALPQATQERRITPDKDEDSQEIPSTPPDTVQVIRDDSPEPNDPKELQEASSTPPNKKGKKRKRSIWSTPKKRRQTKSLPKEISDDYSETNEEKRRPQEPPGTPLSILHDPTKNGNKSPLGKSPGEKPSPEHRIQETLQVMDQATERKDDSMRSSKVMTRAQKARTECVQTLEPKEKSEDETVDFLSPKLPVTCGEAKGILYKEKLKQGSSEKCIQNEAGVWFTPKEFEIEGKQANSRKWKQTVHCKGKTLGELIKKGLLLCPPRISVKRQWENFKECEVCCRGGPLLCCDTCPRAFHEDCHIPPAEAERSPWSCTFCRIESLRRQQCHGESEALERQMQPEEQLKCEFLLLKAYCHPQSSFFAETPHNIRDYGEPFKEAMWLDLVKERLTEQVYTVAWFVRDMRLIFRNHKTFYKASDLGQIGLDLEAEFEKNLKEVFIFCKANENSFQTL